MRKTKYQRINLTKNVHDNYINNCKAWQREIKDPNK